jgi:multiple sugar transport system substrate-binding protein
VIEMKKVVVFLMILSLLTVSFVMASQIELSFWNGFTGPDGSYFQKIVDQFNTEFAGKIHVTMTTMAWGDYWTKVPVSLASGQGPDIGISTEDHILSIADQGMIRPLTPYMNTLGVSKDKFYSAVWDNGYFKNQLWGLPIDQNPLCVLYWNKTLFKEAGLNPNQPPVNRQQFIEYAQKLTKVVNGNQQYGTMISTGWPTYFIWYSIFRQNGGSLFNSDHTKAIYNDNAGLDALQFLYDLVYKYHVSPTNVQVDSDVRAFQNGTVGMEFNGLWELTAYEQTPGLDFGAVLCPQLGSEIPAVDSGADYLVIFNKKGMSNDNIQAALTFFKYVEEHISIWMQSPKLPAEPSVLSDSFFQSIPMLASITKDANNIVYPHFFNLWGQATGPIWDAINYALTGKKTPVQALNDAVNTSNQILASQQTY